MTKTISTAIGGAVVLFVFLGAYAFALSAYADVRGPAPRDRGAIGRVASLPALTSGGISNATGGTADSGGNEGGVVVTGDESVEVHVVNKGPTNSNTVVTNEEEPAPEPEQTCDGRAAECRVQDTGRSR